MKSYGLFCKTIFTKPPKNAPLQFRNWWAFCGTKCIFEIYYLNVLQNGKKFGFGDKNFSSD
jgi:hypothetical protein